MIAKDAGWSGMMMCTSTFRSSSACSKTSQSRNLSSVDLRQVQFPTDNHGIINKVGQCGRHEGDYST